MIKEFPQPQGRAGVIRIVDGMAWRDVDLNALLACCKRELAFRERCYPKWVSKGTLGEKKAAAEIELMRSVVDFLVHCIFKSVTRVSPPSAEPPQ